MPTRDTAPVGAPCWIDLMTSNTERSQAFYCELFDWVAGEPNPEFGGYFNFTRGGVPVAGCIAKGPGTAAPDSWSVYLASDNADMTVSAVAVYGGHPLLPATEIGQLGSMAYVTDPGGAGIGIWEPGIHKGFGVLAEPGAPTWFELHTRGYDEVVDFYENAFGWETHVVSDTDGFRYSTLGEAEGALAGIMDASADLPEGARGQWSIYFGTADTDAALAKVEALGGTILTSAVDTPYGRLATAADPTGAMFKLITTR
jgi:uncharacterized protein